MELLSTDGETFETLGAPKLGEVIDRDRVQIIGGFLGLAKREVPAASHETLQRLKDHLPEVLQQMAAYLRSNGSEIEMDRAVALAKSHAQVRCENPEYTEEQIRREFAIVRETIFGLLGRRCFLEKDAARQFSDICEATLAETVATFVRCRVHH